MFYLLITLGLFCAQINAIIIEGVRFASPLGKVVYLLSDYHPYIKEQDAIKEQLAIVNAYVSAQPQGSLVILNEEPTDYLKERWRAKGVVETLTGIRAIAEQHGILYENIDLRASFSAARRVCMDWLSHSPSEISISFGPCPDAFKGTHELLLDELFEEKEHYIDRIKAVSSWSDVEQHKVDRLHEALVKAIGSFNLHLTVREFCDSINNRDHVRKVERAVSNLDCYLFDTYACRRLLHYNEEHTVMLVTGSRHSMNLKYHLCNDLKWQDYEIYLETQHSKECAGGYILPAETLKDMFGLLTWTDQLKRVFCCRQRF